MKWKWHGIFFLSFGLGLLVLDFPRFPLPLACCFGRGEGSTGPASALGFALGFFFGSGFALGVGGVSFGVGVAGAGVPGFPAPAKSRAYYSLAAMF